MSSTKTTACLYFNPNCSKCRTARSMLEENGAAVEIIEYLKTPPSKNDLRGLLRKMNVPAEQIVRKSEELYKKDYAERVLSEEEWLDVLVQHPILIQRPILVYGDRAIIGRPPEKVLDLIASVSSTVE